MLTFTFYNAQYFIEVLSLLRTYTKNVRCYTCRSKRFDRFARLSNNLATTNKMLDLFLDWLNIRERSNARWNVVLYNLWHRYTSRYSRSTKTQFMHHFFTSHLSWEYQVARIVCKDHAKSTSSLMSINDSWRISQKLHWCCDCRRSCIDSSSQFAIWCSI